MEQSAMMVDGSVLNTSTEVSEADCNVQVGPICLNKIMTPKGHCARQTLTSPVGSINSDWISILKITVKN